MKNKIIAVFALILMVSGVAFAGGIPAAPFTFMPSNNVTFNYTIDGAGSAAQNYAVASKNTAGNRVFASSNTTSNIFYIENDANKGKTISDSLTGVTLPSAGVLDSSSWTSQ